MSVDVDKDTNANKKVPKQLWEAAGQAHLSNGEVWGFPPSNLGEDIESLTEEKEEFKDKLRQLSSENSVLKR